MDKTERWRRASELFDRVTDLPGAERVRILDAECAGDAALRAEVERLLRADEDVDNPLDRDIVAQASALLLDGDAEQHCGQRFGPYRIVRLLAQGGMGRVYLAQREDADFTQTVALKLVGGFGSFDADTAKQRFLEERRILARLEHPHIARLLDGGVGAENQPWFAMEYVDGAPLTEWCDARKLEVKARLQLFAKVCDAADHAHRFLIVHRDLKPGNVLVDARGEPKVLDFGIAKLLDEGDRARTGSTILMTPDYAAPEQMRGGQISTATDVYGLGAVLFELLTGRKPFADPLVSREPPQASRAATEGADDTGKRAADRGTTPVSLRRSLRGDLDRILRTALDPNPQRRYRSAATLAEDLRAVAQGRPISLRSDRAYRVGIFLRQHRWAVSAAAAAILALLGTTGWALWQQRQARAQAQEAARQADIAKKEALASEKASKLLFSSFTPADPGSRKSFAEPTAKQILDATAERVAKELTDVPELRARTQMHLGRTYLNLGITDKALEQLQAATATYLSPAVDRPDLAADVLIFQSTVETDLHHREKAIELARRSLALRQRGNDQKAIMDAYNTLGVALLTPGHYEEAGRVMARVHEFRVRAFGERSEQVARSFNNQGGLARDAGKAREAERLLRASLALKSELKLPLQDLQGSRSLLAMALVDQARFAEAESLLQTSLNLAPELYGADSNKLTKLHGRLGILYREKGDLTQARSHYRQAVDIEKQASDSRDATAGRWAGALAQILELQGDVKEAERYYRMAEDALIAQLPSDDPAVVRAIAQYEAFKARETMGSASSERFKSALSAWIGAYGPGRRHIPADLAEALFMEAERRLAVGDTDLQTLLPPEDPTLEQPMIQAGRHYWLGRAAQARGERDTALAEYQRALDIAGRFAGKDSIWPALWRLDYANLLQSSGRIDEARAQRRLAEAPLEAQILPQARAQRLRSPHVPARGRSAVSQAP